MVSFGRYLVLVAQSLALMVVAFFFGGGLNILLYLKVDQQTGLGLEEAVYLMVAFGVYCVFSALSFMFSGKSYSESPHAIFEMTEINTARTQAKHFQGPRFFNLNERDSLSAEVKAADAKHNIHRSSSNKSKKRKKKKKKSKSTTTPTRDLETGDSKSSDFELQYFTLPYVMKAGFGGRLMRRGVEAPERLWRRPLKYQAFNLWCVTTPFIFIMVPLVPCWLRDSNGYNCFGSGSPVAVFIVIWNSLISFLLSVHYAGMMLTVGALLTHCEGMCRVMRSLVSRIDSIDKLECWHTTMWRLHRHMLRRIKPFKILICGSFVFAILFTLAAVALGIAHFSVTDKEEVNEMESAWIQLLMCAVAFSLPSLFVFAFTAQVNSILSKAIDRLDATGGGQEISLAEYYSTVIEYWKRRRKGFVFCGVHLTDVSCFYFTLALCVIALVPIVYSGSF